MAPSCVNYRKSEVISLFPSSENESHSWTHPQTSDKWMIYSFIPHWIHQLTNPQSTIHLYHCPLPTQKLLVDISRTNVVVKRQAEEVGKRAPDKLRTQENHKHKTRARLKKCTWKQKARRQSNQTTVKLKLSSQASESYSLSLRSSGLTRAASS